MKLALKEANIAYLKGEIPIGAIIVDNEKIISKAHNCVKSSEDPTMHAEIRAIKLACNLKKTRYLTNCDLYVTVEPCYMCYAAIAMARIQNIFYGAYSKKYGAINNNNYIKFPPVYKIKQVHNGFMKQECSILMKDFFLKIRKNKN